MMDFGQGMVRPGAWAVGNVLVREKPSAFVVQDITPSWAANVALPLSPELWSARAVQETEDRIVRQRALERAYRKSYPSPSVICWTDMTTGAVEYSEAVGR